MRRLMFAALLIPAAAQAQPAPPPHPMPGYDDSYDRYGGFQDDQDTRDMHHDVDQTPPPPPVPDGYGYGYGGDGQDRGYDDAGQDPRDTPPPPPGPGRYDDPAHRADRARTGDLNRGPHTGYNALPPRDGYGYGTQSGEYRQALADHARDMQVYRDQQARYADRVARWRARADACEHGDRYACDGPE